MAAHGVFLSAVAGFFDPSVKLSRLCVRCYSCAGSSKSEILLPPDTLGQNGADEPPDSRDYLKTAPARPLRIFKGDRI